LAYGTRWALLVGSLAFLIFFVGSCGGSRYNVQDVTVTISPAEKTIPASGQVALTASVNNFCSMCVPQINWSVVEGNGTTCSLSGCGTIQGQGTQGLLSPSVIYFAPSKAGTYIITASQLVTYTTSVSGTSVITVSP
jgi:hypothetical protein